ncbi:MAG: DNA translocase FtsK 4TM domain-containing protein [Pyramidobacter sp.]|nr:DNA translocase FtsK 4TM domain-containing protein [Pyramidobacter sp.]
MKTAKKYSARRSRGGRSRGKRGFEFGALFRLCQFLIAAVLLYVAASLFAIGTGVLGEDMASCILRFAGGGVILILLHLFYGLFCSLLHRHIHSICSQWLGTLSLYAALCVFLGMLQRAGMTRDIGLLSPGIIGSVVAQVMPLFIGVVGTMLIGLSLVVFAAFNYGHLSAARVSWVRAHLALIRLPSWPEWLKFRRKKNAEDDFDAEPETEQEPVAPPVAECETEPELPLPEEIAPQEVVSEEEEEEDPVKKPRRWNFESLGAVKAAFQSLFGKGEEDEEPGEEVLDENEDSLDEPDEFEYDEQQGEETDSESPATDADASEEERSFSSSCADIADEQPYQPAADVPVSKTPSVEVERMDNVEGTDAVQFYAGRAIPEGAFPPPLDLLGPHVPVSEVVDDRAAQENGQEVIAALANFGVSAELKHTVIGPTVVQYQIQLAPGIKVSKVSALDNDIAVALAVPSIRVEAPIPGTTYVGIELPNQRRRAVPLRQILESETFQKTDLKLPLPLGQTVDGRILIAGLEELPHLLVAGTTGSGKSIFVNNCIAALCYHNTPSDLRFIMVDPKRVEMGIYESLPHILAKPIVTPSAAVHALAWAVREMENRYDACSQVKARNIASYNEKVLPKDRMPHIVIIVDELADLMMTAQKEVEEYIMRLAQMARAVGIHLILATQRPSVNVLTGTIKANVPARVSFSLPSVADSRTILDVSGAQHLLGKGDMLFISTRHPRPLRIQSPFMDEQTNIRIVEYLRKTFGDPDYVDLEEQGESKSQDNAANFLEDNRLEEAIKIVLNTGVASSSGLQRQMRVGFTRAARMIDTMEAMGIVGPQNGAKPREILVDEEGALDILDRYR